MPQIIYFDNVLFVNFLFIAAFIIPFYPGTLPLQYLHPIFLWGIKSTEAYNEPVINHNSLANKPLLGR